MLMPEQRELEAIRQRVAAHAELTQPARVRGDHVAEMLSRGQDAALRGVTGEQRLLELGDG
ncbi:hypothetical protein WMF38_14870 [Sorangium sp. So ce118]